MVSNNLGAVTAPRFPEVMATYRGSSATAAVGVAGVDEVVDGVAVVVVDGVLEELELVG